jgi:hypothetical protein
MIAEMAHLFLVETSMKRVDAEKWVADTNANSLNYEGQEEPQSSFGHVDRILIHEDDYVDDEKNWHIEIVGVRDGKEQDVHDLQMTSQLIVKTCW